LAQWLQEALEQLAAAAADLGADDGADEPSTAPSAPSGTVVPSAAAAQSSLDAFIGRARDWARRHDPAPTPDGAAAGGAALFPAFPAAYARLVRPQTAPGSTFDVVFGATLTRLAGAAAERALRRRVAEAKGTFTRALAEAVEAASRVYGGLPLGAAAAPLVGPAGGAAGGANRLRKVNPASSASAAQASVAAPAAVQAAAPVSDEATLESYIRQLAPDGSGGVAAGAALDAAASGSGALLLHSAVRDVSSAPLFHLPRFGGAEGAADASDGQRAALAAAEGADGDALYLEGEGEAIVAAALTSILLPAFAAQAAETGRLSLAAALGAVAAQTIEQLLAAVEAFRAHRPTTAAAEDALAASSAAAAIAEEVINDFAAAFETTLAALGGLAVRAAEAMTAALRAGQAVDAVAPVAAVASGVACAVAAAVAEGVAPTLGVAFSAAGARIARAGAAAAVASGTSLGAYGVWPAVWHWRNAVADCFGGAGMAKAGWKSVPISGGEGEEAVCVSVPLGISAGLAHALSRLARLLALMPGRSSLAVASGQAVARALLGLTFTTAAQELTAPGRSAKASTEDVEATIVQLLVDTYAAGHLFSDETIPAAVANASPDASAATAEAAFPSPWTLAWQAGTGRRAAGLADGTVKTLAASASDVCMAVLAKRNDIVPHTVISALKSSAMGNLCSPDILWSALVSASDIGVSPFVEEFDVATVDAAPGAALDPVDWALTEPQVVAVARESLRAHSSEWASLVSSSACFGSHSPEVVGSVKIAMKLYPLRLQLSDAGHRPNRPRWSLAEVTGSWSSKKTLSPREAMLLVHLPVANLSAADFDASKFPAFPCVPQILLPRLQLLTIPTAPSHRQLDTDTPTEDPGLSTLPLSVLTPTKRRKRNQHSRQTGDAQKSALLSPVGKLSLLREREEITDNSNKQGGLAAKLVASSVSTSLLGFFSSAFGSAK
jgi:hypothetical protein